MTNRLKIKLLLLSHHLVLIDLIFIVSSKYNHYLRTLLNYVYKTL